MPNLGLSEIDKQYIIRAWRVHPPQDIAAVLGCSPETVRNHAHMMKLGPAKKKFGGVYRPDLADREGWPALTADPWPAEARFRDAPEADRYGQPVEIDPRRTLRRSAVASPGNGTRLCMEMA